MDILRLVTQLLRISGFCQWRCHSVCASRSPPSRCCAYHEDSHCWDRNCSEVCLPKHLFREWDCSEACLPKWV